MKKLTIWLALTLVCNFTVFSQFVTVENTKFKLGKNDFYFQGGNIHHIAFNKSGSPTNFSNNDIDAIFKHYKEKKITVVRAWAYFNKDVTDSNETAFQLDWRTGVNNAGVQKLYYVIKKAEEYDIKLILAFTNFEQDFGGMAWYVKKYLEKFEGKTNINLREDFKKNGKYGSRKIDFYWNGKIKSAFKLYVSSLLNSKNPLTGRLIKNEPAIMAWDLANEPHTIDNAESWPNKGNAVYGWLNEMANYVKSIDKNHLITTGEEGYLADRNTKTGFPYSWINDGTKGVDFAKNRWIKNIDFMTIHAYPDRWREGADGDARAALEWGAFNFFKNRADLSKQANMPLVMEEYGYSFENDRKQSPSNNKRIRGEYLRRMHQIANNNNIAGMVVWQLIPHKHSYKTHFPGSDDYDISYDWNEDGTQAIYDNANFLFNKGFKQNNQSASNSNNNNANPTIQSAPNSISRIGKRSYKLVVKYPKKGRVAVSLKNSNTFQLYGKVYNPTNATFAGQVIEHWLWVNQDIPWNTNLIWEIKTFDNNNKAIGYTSKSVSLNGSKFLDNPNEAPTTTAYPIPMEDVLNIESNENITYAELVNLAGKVVLKQTFKNQDTVKQLDTSKLVSKQVYFLNLYNTNGKFDIRKLIKL